MILADLEDIREIHSWSHFNKEAFIHPELTPQEELDAMQDPDWFDKHPEKRYYPGPYLIRVNDEKVWISRGHGDDWRFVVQRFRHQSVEQRQWMAYLELYADGIGVSTRTLLNRFTGMRRRLIKEPNLWHNWDKIYPWPEGSEEVWDAIYEHSIFEKNVLEGRKMVRYVR